MKKKEKEPVQTPAPPSVPRFALDFGGSLGGSLVCLCQGGTGRKSGFDNTPRVPHDPFKMKPPEYPSLF